MLDFRWTSVGGACSDKQVMDQLRVKSEICYTSKEVCKISWKSCDAASARTQKTILLAFAPPFKASWCSSRKPSYQYTFNFRHKKIPWNLNMAPKRKKFSHQEDPCWDFTFNLPGCSEQICHVPSGDQPADAPCPPAPCPSPPWPGDEGCEAEIPRSWWV